MKFSALQSAKASDVKALNVTKDVAIETKILTLIKENISTTTIEMVRLLSVNRWTIQRGLDVLKNIYNTIKYYVSLSNFYLY